MSPRPSLASVLTWLRRRSSHGPREPQRLPLFLSPPAPPRARRALPHRTRGGGGAARVHTGPGVAGGVWPNRCRAGGTEACVSPSKASVTDGHARGRFPPFHRVLWPDFEQRRRGRSALPRPPRSRSDSERRSRREAAGRGVTGAEARPFPQRRHSHPPLCLRSASRRRTRRCRRCRTRSPRCGRWWRCWTRTPRPAACGSSSPPRRRAPLKLFFKTWDYREIRSFVTFDTSF